MKGNTEKVDRKKLCETTRLWIGERPPPTFSAFAHLHSVPATALRDAVRLLQKDARQFARYERGEVSRYEAYKRCDNSFWLPHEHRKVQRLTRIRELAEAGHHTEHIAREVGLGRQHLRELMRKHLIKIPERRDDGSVQASRVIDATASGLEAYVIGVESLGSDFTIASDQAASLAASIGKSLRVLKQLHHHLKELAHGHGQTQE